MAPGHSSSRPEQTKHLVRAHPRSPGVRIPLRRAAHIPRLAKSDGNVRLAIEDNVVDL